MNIPALIQCKDIQEDWDGKMAVVDGYNACVYVDPTPDLLKSLKKRQQEDQKKQALLQELKGKPNTTLDARPSTSLPTSAAWATWALCSRTTPAASASSAPSSSTSTARTSRRRTTSRGIQAGARELAPRKVVVRTCDIGADKTVDYMKLDHEENPALATAPSASA